VSHRYAAITRLQRGFDARDRRRFCLLAAAGGRRHGANELDHERAIGIELRGRLRLEKLLRGAERFERARLDLLRRVGEPEAGAAAFGRLAAAMCCAIAPASLKLSKKLLSLTATRSPAPAAPLRRVSISVSVNGCAFMFAPSQGLVRRSARRCPRCNLSVSRLRRRGKSDL
jgi:hypothetical protein